MITKYKIYESGEIESEVEKLYKELQFHYGKVTEFDSKLAKMCMEQIQELLDNGKGYEAKEVFRKFYRFDVDDICFDKDMVLMKINRVVKLEDQTNKYNL